MENRLVGAKSKRPLKLKSIGLIIGGSFLFAMSVNVFMVPIHLYVGGVVGVSQVIAKVFFSSVTKFNVTGLINLLFNIPLFVLGYKTAGKKMLFGTLLSVVVQTITFSLIPIPKEMVFDDKLTNIIVSGIVGGIGVGGILSGGASGGGLDLLGLYLTKVRKRFSVGRMSLYFNTVLYIVCAILFDVRIALYSVIYVAIFSFMIDRWHYQNIEMQLMIFTHCEEVKTMILQKYIRGVTYWEGKGAYTNQETEVLCTIVSKSEVESVKQDILSLDPKAFIICSEGLQVTGGYEKRLSDTKD